MSEAMNAALRARLIRAGIIVPVEVVLARPANDPIRQRAQDAIVAYGSVRTWRP